MTAVRHPHYRGSRANPARPAADIRLGCTRSHAICTRACPRPRRAARCHTTPRLGWPPRHESASTFRHDPEATAQVRLRSDAGLSFVFVANASRCVFCFQLSCSAPSPAELGPHGLIDRGSCSVRAPLCACFRRPCPGRLHTRLLPRHLRHRAVPLGPARCWLQASIACRRAALPGPVLGTPRPARR